MASDGKFSDAEIRELLADVINAANPAHKMVQDFQKKVDDVYSRDEPDLVDGLHGRTIDGSPDPPHERMNLKQTLLSSKEVLHFHRGCVDRIQTNGGREEDKFVEHFKELKVKLDQLHGSLDVFMVLMGLDECPLPQPNIPDIRMEVVHIITLINQIANDTGLIKGVLEKHLDALSNA